jgi:hypothetical protein
MLQDIYRTLNFRIAGFDRQGQRWVQPRPPTGQSVEWFRNGELDKVAEYCKSDVDITRWVY